MHQRETDIELGARKILMRIPTARYSIIFTTHGLHLNYNENFISTVCCKKNVLKSLRIELILAKCLVHSRFSVNRKPSVLSFFRVVIYKEEREKKWEECGFIPGLGVKFQLCHW